MTVEALAVRAWLAAADRGAEAAATAAAEALALHPWLALAAAGQLARCALSVAPVDVGLTSRLAVVAVDDRRAAFRVGAGSAYPILNRAGRLTQGAFDTPRERANDLVAETRKFARRTGRVLDPCCGTGALLLAAWEQGATDLWGTDIDPIAIAVARVVVPTARFAVADVLDDGEQADVVVTNPPFVSAERQGPAMRRQLRARFPWLERRFDLWVPTAAAAVQRVRPGGVAGLVLPISILGAPYAEGLRRRWLQQIRVASLSETRRFPGVAQPVVNVVLAAFEGPSRLPVADTLALPRAAWIPELVAGDSGILAMVLRRSEPLGNSCRIDTGLVGFGGGHIRDSRVFDEPGKGRRPYASVAALERGECRFIDYDDAILHRKKDPALFEGPKVVVQRVHGGTGRRVVVDRSGTFVDHTATVVVPGAPCPLSVEEIAKWITDPIALGLLRLRTGDSLDLYPRDLAWLPLPSAWRDPPFLDAEIALALSPQQADRLRVIGRTVR